MGSIILEPAGQSGYDLGHTSKLQGRLQNKIEEICDDLAADFQQIGAFRLEVLENGHWQVGLPLRPAVRIGLHMKLKPEGILAKTKRLVRVVVRGEQAPRQIEP